MSPRTVLAALLGAAIVVGLAVLGVAGPTAHYETFHAPDGKTVLLPDPVATPGVFDPTLTREDACKPERLRTQDGRNVPASVKASRYAAYGAVKQTGVCCEIDHRCPVKLCGSNDPKNLWPQAYTPKPGAHEKDWLEDRIIRAVCTEHTLTLAQGQAVFLGNWYTAYRHWRGAR